jgi:cytochrome b6-f complex iron-sulfur subunit
MLIHRREVLLALGALPLTGCLSHTTLHATVEGGAITLKPGEVAGLAGVGDALIVRADGVPGPVILRRSAGGGFTAMLAVCTHQGCELEVAPESYDCPCHGSAFDLQGRVLTGPADRPLPALVVKASAERVVIVLAQGAP